MNAGFIEVNPDSFPKVSSGLSLNNLTDFHVED